MKKRFAAIFLVLLMVFTASPLTTMGDTTSYTDSSGVVYQLSADGSYAKVTDGIAAYGQVTILSSVTIGGSSYPVKEISASAFLGSAISSVTLASSVEHIGDCAFAYCPSLASIDFQSAQVSLGNRVFDGSSALSEIKNSSGIKKVGHGAFDGTTWFGDSVSACSDSAVYLGKVLLTFVGDADSFSIDANASAIAPDAFKNNSTLTSVDLSNVVSVGDSAFYGCTALESIIFGQNLSEIGSYAFDSCCALSGTITLPASLKKLGAGAFSKTEISIADLSATQLVSIKNGCFADCLSLTKIVLPASVAAIENFAFEDSTLLSDINAQNVVSIGYDAFRRCSALSDKSLFANAEYVASGAFDGTEIYTSANGNAVVIGKAFYKTEETAVSLAIDEGVKQISPYAFYAATDLDKLALPVSLEKINEKAFLSMEDGTIFAFSSADSVYEALSALPAGTIYIPADKSVTNENVTVGNITGISIAASPTKTSYKASEQFDASGMMIVLDTTIGTTSESFDIADIGYSPAYTYDFNVSPTITVSYCGYTTTLEVTVEKEIMLGDLNNDEMVSTDDLIILRKYIAGLISSDSFNIDAADLNKSGNVTTDDLVMLRKVIAGLITLD